MFIALLIGYPRSLRNFKEADFACILGYLHVYTKHCGVNYTSAISLYLAAKPPPLVGLQQWCMYPYYLMTLTSEIAVFCSKVKGDLDWQT